MSKLESVKVENVDDETLYVARLEFRSKGKGLAVQPYFEYSHLFPDDYNGEYPAAFLAMRDIAIMLSMMTQQVFNTEYDELPDDPDQAAELVLAKANIDPEEPIH